MAVDYIYHKEKAARNFRNCLFSMPSSRLRAALVLIVLQVTKIVELVNMKYQTTDGGNLLDMRTKWDQELRNSKEFKLR